MTFGAPVPLLTNPAGWCDAVPVSIAYTASDALSGLASATQASPLTFGAEGASQTQTVTATDVAGNTTTAASPVVNIDLTAPAVTARAAPAAVNRGGGNRNVTVSGAVTDPLSGPDTSVGNGTYQITDSKSQTRLFEFESG